MQPLVLQPKLQALFSNARKRMFQPGLADLFEALVVIGAAAHPVEILWDNRMIRLR